MAVGLSIANETASLPIASRLYLPGAWAQDPALRRKAKIPDGVGFQTKPQIALDQIRDAVATGTPAGVILADAGYGADGAFRSGLSGRGLDYVLGVRPTLSVWRPGETPLPPKAWSGTGRPPSLMRRSRDHRPLSAKALAQELPADAWQSITWREGSNIDLASRFAAVRVRPASRDYYLTRPRAQEWLLIEWPEGDAEPLEHWLSTLSAEVPLRDLVATAKLRGRIERDYRELILKVAREGGAARDRPSRPRLSGEPFPNTPDRRVDRAGTASMFELIQLRCFVALAEELHFRRAAIAATRRSHR